MPGHRARGQWDTLRRSGLGSLRPGPYRAGPNCVERGYALRYSHLVPVTRTAGDSPSTRHPFTSPLCSGLLDDGALGVAGSPPSDPADGPTGARARAGIATASAGTVAGVVAGWFDRPASARAVVHALRCPDHQLHALGLALSAVPERYPEDVPVPLALAVSGGAGAVGPALTRAGREPRIQLLTVAVVLRDEPDLSRNARRVVRAFDDALPDGVDGYLVLPDHGAVGPALDVVAEAGRRACLRVTGPDHRPPAARLAQHIVGCLDREVPFAVVGADAALAAAAPLARPGFLNILLATRACLDGAGADDLTRLLELHDPSAISAEIAALDPAAASSARRWCTAATVRSVPAAVEDLLALPAVEE